MHNYQIIPYPIYYLFYLSEITYLFIRHPLKSVKVMHAVALRTEATLNGGEAPANLGQAFKVTIIYSYLMA